MKYEINDTFDSETLITIAVYTDDEWSELSKFLLKHKAEYVNQDD